MDKMVNNLLKTIPTFMSMSLLASNIKSFDDSLHGKKNKIVKQGLTNIVGTSLIKETANFTDF